MPTMLNVGVAGSLNPLTWLILGVAGDLITDKPFGGNQERLAILKHKYDPDLLFNKTNPIKPLRAEAN